MLEDGYELGRELLRVNRLCWLVVSVVQWLLDCRQLLTRKTERGKKTRDKVHDFQVVIRTGVARPISRFGTRLSQVRWKPPVLRMNLHRMTGKGTKVEWLTWDMGVSKRSAAGSRGLGKGESVRLDERGGGVRLLWSEESLVGEMEIESTRMYHNDRGFCDTCTVIS